jgi:hypothetical protein
MRNSIGHVGAVVIVGRPLKQARISKVFYKIERRELNKIWAKISYKANIHFIVSKNKTFRKVVRRTTNFC